MGYWHTKKDRIEKDNYRKKELKKLGYNVKIIDVKIKNEELFKKL